MIIETIFSTLDEEGRPNFAPMGVIWEEMVLRPFRNTITYRNLVSQGQGVVSVTDNVLTFAQSAISNAQFPHFPARKVRGVVLEDVCYWRELEVLSVNEHEERAEICCRVVAKGRKRDFLGFNRGKNAVIEAAILATRLDLNERDEVKIALGRLDGIVAKTGGKEEEEAMKFLSGYVRRYYGED